MLRTVMVIQEKQYELYNSTNSQFLGGLILTLLSRHTANNLQFPKPSEYFPFHTYSICFAVPCT